MARMMNLSMVASYYHPHAIADALRTYNFYLLNSTTNTVLMYDPDAQLLGILTFHTQGNGYTATLTTIHAQMSHSGMKLESFHYDDRKFELHFQYDDEHYYTVTFMAGYDLITGKTKKSQ